VSEPTAAQPSEPSEPSGPQPPAPPAGPSGSQYLKLIGIGALIGIPAALAAALFFALVHACETWLWTDLPSALGQHSPPWYLVVFLPAVGAVLVWFARRFLPGDGGHEPLKGIGGGATPWQYAPSILLAAVATLAFGAVLGPEAPLIALGSLVGMIAVDAMKVEGPGKVVLATAGSFSAVSALFGGPLVAGILLLEVGLSEGAALLPALLPGLVAASVGYVLFDGLGSWGGLAKAPLAVPDLPLYNGTRVVDLLLAIVVGVLAAALITVVRRFAASVLARAKGRMFVGLVVGGLGVGLVAEVARLLGANSQDVLFSGQSSLPALIVVGSAGTLLVLLLGKAIGYAISLGCGFRGGPVFPAIFIGTAIASFAVVWWGVSPTWAVAVGTAAGMTAGTRLIFASLLLGSILVGVNGIDALPAAVLAATAAWLTAKALDEVVAKRWPAPQPA
jgi:H+/Cl- antiporter ClcA